MSVSSSWELSSDAELITAVRSGEPAAFGALYERHLGAARAVARQYSNSLHDADDAVADAFSRVFATVQRGGGPDVAFRAYLFTVVRRVALERIENGRRVETTDDMTAFESAFGAGQSTEEPTFEGFERGVVSRAYKSLPERWQAVLWYTEIEQLNPAQIAPVLGLTANGVAALAYRAREGLRQAYLQQHLATPASEACTIVNAKLGGYVRGGLAKRETALVESHLEECGNCRTLVLELGDVNHGLRAVVAPLVLGAVAIGVLHGVGFGGAAGSAAAGAAAGASGVTAGSTAGAASGAVGVGAGVGAGTATGGLAALVGALPIGVMALVASGVVVAAAVGVAGMLGMFSSGDEPADVVAEAPLDLPGGGSGGDVVVDEPDPTQTAPADPSDPANVPEESPTSPQVQADPAHVAVVDLDLDEASFVAGSPHTVLVRVRNDGGQSADQVRTELSFPPGTDVDVVALQAPTGGRFSLAAAALSDWTCAMATELDAEVATCTLPVLAGGASSTLAAGVTIHDDRLDGDRPLEVRVRAWAPGTPEAPTPTTVATRVSSRPARITATSPEAVTLTGAMDAPVTQTVSVPVRNDGGTTVPVDATVTVPADLPAGVSVAGLAPWTCTGQGVVACHLPELRRGATQPLVLQVTAATGLTDIAFPGSLDVTVPNATVTAPLTIRSAPAAVTATWDPFDRLDGDADEPVWVDVRNDGGTTARAQAQVTVPPGAVPADPAGDGWTDCEAADDGAVICRRELVLTPGAAPRLGLTVRRAVLDSEMAAQLRVLVMQAQATEPILEDVHDVDLVPDPPTTTARLAFSGTPAATFRSNIDGGVAFVVENTGEAAATAVTAEIALPLGIAFDGSADVPAPWSCTFTPSDRTATCGLASLGAGESAALQLPATAYGEPPWPDVTITLWADGLDPTTVSVPAVEMAAALTVVGDSTRALAGGTGDVRYVVSNTGGTTVRDLTITIGYGGLWDMDTKAGSLWTCRARGIFGWTLRCTLDELAPHGIEPLELEVSTRSLLSTWRHGDYRFPADWTSDNAGAGSATATLSVEGR